jgi:hypothetical protein
LVPNHPLKFLLILAFAALACGFPSGAPPTQTPEPVQAATATVPPIMGVSLDQLTNAQYQPGARNDPTVVQLTGGKYQQGTDTLSADYAAIELTDFVAFGDLDGDGLNEAAAMFVENYGGTGSFAMLALYTIVDGQPMFLTSILIDDRPLINNIAIENGEVFLDATTHGFEDPSCCPTLATTRRYVLVNNQLRMVHYTTNTPDGSKREIEIAIPLNGTEASGSVQVSGTVSISPFENNLSYFIYDESGNQYASGALAVTAPDLGAPGTFDEVFPLEGIPAGAIIYLELQDISAADGSWLAMDAVKILVK